MAQAFGVGGFGPLEDQVRRNMEMFEKTFAMFAPFARGQNSGQGSGLGTGQGKSAEKPTAGGAGEMDELKRQMEEMQKRLDKLGKE
jgi:polyhydroxyalkanoate synthesis regulator protein